MMPERGMPARARQLLWFAGLWLASALVVAALAYGLRALVFSL